MANVITRRSFVKAGLQATVASGLASLVNVPLFLQRALAEGNVGLNGKKVLFIFLRGGNDGINNIVPINDPGYAFFRPGIGQLKDPALLYDAATGQADAPGVIQPYALRLGNGFAALNPNLYDLAPLFNSGHLALLHRVAYRSQSRSHFDSEKYWEKAADGTANNRALNDGVWYRTLVESGWNQTHALSGVSIQSNMPQSLRGTQPMTNLGSIDRYNLRGVTGTGATSTTAADRLKHLNAIDAAVGRPHPDKDNREMVLGLANAFRDTLDIFQDPAYGFAKNEFFDSDGTTHLFPLAGGATGSDEKGLGSGAYGFFQNLKSAAQVLASTDAVIAGTEMGGFDTHTAQVTPGNPQAGGHGALLRRVGWAFHALWKYFSNPAYSPKVRWEDVVIITMSEFGRTSAENGSMGTDHAEASVMYVGGGGIRGGVYGCDTNLNPILNAPNWTPCTPVAGTTPTVLKDGSMFAANSSVGYLRRAIDYRSVLGEIIRDHLGATPAQLNRIIPAYASESTERLQSGGLVSTTPIVGELGLI